MERSVKNASNAPGASTSRVARVTSTPNSAKTVPTSKANEHGLQSFSFEGTHEVQVIMHNGEPHFIAVDICNVLCLSNPTKSLYGLEDDEHLTLPLVRAGQSRTVNVVNESGLYALIFQSRKPVAKTFRKWVTSEVLPSIRKTGIFSTTPLPYLLFSDCITLTCTDVGGQTRQMYLYYNVSGDWFQETTIDCANLIQGYMKQLGKLDKKVVAVKTEWLRLRNGKYEPSTIMFPAWEKETEKQADPIAQCERAISDYNKARARVKEAAGSVVNHIYPTSKS